MTAAVPLDCVGRAMMICRHTHCMKYSSKHRLSHCTNTYVSTSLLRLFCIYPIWWQSIKLICRGAYKWNFGWVSGILFNVVILRASAEWIKPVQKVCLFNRLFTQTRSKGLFCQALILYSDWRPPLQGVVLPRFLLLSFDKLSLLQVYCKLS